MHRIRDTGRWRTGAVVCWLIGFTLMAVVGVPDTAVAQDRLPPIPPDRMTDAQRDAAVRFEENRGTPVFGPFVPLLRSPELMLRAMAMGDYLRFGSSLPLRLSEMAILLTARQWTQQYEWVVHAPAAIDAGLRQEIVEAIAEGRRPERMAGDEEVVYELTIELHRNQGVSDRTYARAVGTLGEQGTIDLVSTAGYYTFLAMVLNTARTALPSGVDPPLAPFPR